MVALVKIPETRTYNRAECITFRKTAEKFGGLSNMAGGYLLDINGINILTSEALYQACRFPHMPEIQRLIIAERSPMTAKMKSKPYRDNSRTDWDIVRTKIMRWCLQIKLIQNWDKFSELLLQTADLPIVEDSRKDDFWGAKPQDEEILIGANVLGRLLMELRMKVKNGEITSQTIIKPLPIPNFLLYGEEIQLISINSEYHLFKYTDLSESNGVSSQDDSNIFVLSASKDDNLESSLNNNLQEKFAEVNEPEFDKYDSLKFILPSIVQSLQESERTDKELADLCKTNLPQMRDWLRRAVEMRKIRKLSKPVRYIAESQLHLIN